MNSDSSFDPLPRGARAMAWYHAANDGPGDDHRVGESDGRLGVHQVVVEEDE